MVRHVYDLLLIYNHMKREEDRYGMQVKLTDMMKIAKIWDNIKRRNESKWNLKAQVLYISYVDSKIGRFCQNRCWNKAISNSSIDRYTENYNFNYIVR